MGKNIIRYLKLSYLLKIIFYLKNCLVYQHLEIGSYIRKPLKISGKKYISIGNSIIEMNARIEAVPFYQNANFEPKIIIEDNVSIGQNLHLTCANEVIISNGTSLTPNVGIFDIIHPYEDILKNPRNQEIRTKPIFIGQNCLIGMNSVILPGTHLGRHCIVGANSVVSGIYSDFSVLAGVPAKIIKRFNFETNKWERTNPDGSFINVLR